MKDKFRIVILFLEFKKNRSIYFIKKNNFYKVGTKYFLNLNTIKIDMSRIPY